MNSHMHYPLEENVEFGLMTREQAQRCNKCANFETDEFWVEGMEDEIVWISCGGTPNKDVCEKFEEE